MRPCAVASVAIRVFSCGDSATTSPDAQICVPVAPLRVEGLLASPVDLPQQGCQLGTFADFNPTGLWWLHRTVSG